MHIFLHGPINIGKSTVIRKTLDIIIQKKPLTIGGFYTWRSGDDAPEIYLSPAGAGREREIHRLASYNKEKGGFICDYSVFSTAARYLSESIDADLIIMDELGFLESEAPDFQRAVHDTLAANVPMLGVLRTGKHIPWHDEIKKNPQVTLQEVSEKNRDSLPQDLAGWFNSQITKQR